MESNTWNSRNSKTSFKVEDRKWRLKVGELSKRRSNKRVLYFRLNHISLILLPKLKKKKKKKKLPLLVILAYQVTKGHLYIDLAPSTKGRDYWTNVIHQQQRLPQEWCLWELLRERTRPSSPSSMKILAWNIRGASHLDFLDHILTLINFHKPCILIL